MNPFYDNGSYIWNKNSVGVFGGFYTELLFDIKFILIFPFVE